jgi:hypothetical protein
MQSVALALLSYRASPDVLTMFSLRQAEQELLAAGIACDVIPYSGNSILPQARNEIVAAFLETDHTDLVMIDDDVAWKAGGMLRLVRHPVDLVGGIYPGRCDPENYKIRWNTAKPYLVADPETGLLEIEAVPTGFLRFTRACLTKMVEAHPHLEYVNDTGRVETALFDFELLDRRYWGEDFTFCRRWRALGGRVWCDPEITFAHVGRKVFYGHFGNWMRNRETFNEAAQAFNDAMKGAA